MGCPGLLLMTRVNWVSSVITMKDVHLHSTKQLVRHREIKCGSS